jgi:hypothetical protein
MDNRKSKYSNEERHKIVGKIEALKNNEMYHRIFNILTEDAKSTYSQNCNGVFLNFSAISDVTLDKVVKYLNKISKVTKVAVEEYPNYIPYATAETGPKVLGPKLSNHEKKIIHRKNVKSTLDKLEATAGVLSQSDSTSEVTPVPKSTRTKSKRVQVETM